MFPNLKLGEDKFLNAHIHENTALFSEVSRLTEESLIEAKEAIVKDSFDFKKGTTYKDAPLL
jgi:hypothetical protein